MKMKKSDVVFFALVALVVTIVLLILIKPSGSELAVPSICYSTKSYGYNEQTGKWIAIKVDSKGYVILSKENCDQ
jgi:hypothetical protein